MSWLQSIRTIVEDSQYRHIDPETGHLCPKGRRRAVLVDLFSASAMLSVHDQLNEVNREKFLSLPFLKAHRVAFKLIK